MYFRKLKKNAFSDTFDMGDKVSEQLQLVDLQNNNISHFTLGSRYTKTLMWEKTLPFFTMLDLILFFALTFMHSYEGYLF